MLTGRFIALGLLCLSLANPQGSGGPALSVDAAAQNHSISPDIYGINDYSDQGLASGLRLSVRRWGGDLTTRYNWLLDSYNAASDWYYEDFTASNATSNLPDNSKFNQVMELSRTTGTRTIGTIPMIGWIAKTRDQVCSFAIAKYGPQQQTDPYNSHCGSGIRLDGSNITDNDPNDASMPVDVNAMRKWVEYLLTKASGPSPCLA